jgi:hypothetical protein
MIILSSQQAREFSIFLRKWAAVIPQGHAIQPIEIKNEKYILPNSVLTDPCFKELKSKLTIDLSTLEIRDIKESELIVEKLWFEP